MEAPWKGATKGRYKRPCSSRSTELCAPCGGLKNPSLIRAHIHAEWLAQVGLPLRTSIGQVIDTDSRNPDGSPTLLLKAEVKPQLSLNDQAMGSLRDRLHRILAANQELLEDADWYSPQWVEQVLI